MPSTTLHPGPSFLARPVVQAVLVVAVCAVIYWPKLGDSGFSATEGHRAIPAWEILDRGEWLVTTLFERPYLRKPPGMPWAIAALSALLGQTEFAARAVSAGSTTVMALVSLWFGRRWFSPVGGLAAGLAQALTPRWWSPGRSAEIESLNNLGALVAVLALTDLALQIGKSRLGLAGLAALGLIIAGLSKGPAGMPAVVGALTGACLVNRGVAAILKPAVWGSVLVGLATVLGVLALVAARARGLEARPVTQSVGEFLWQPGQRWNVLAMPWVALGSAMPGTLALLFPWGPDGRAEGDVGQPAEHRRAFRVGFALTWAVVVGLVILLVIGSHNPRYAMPVLTPIALVVGYVAHGMTGWFTPLRIKIAWWLGLGWRWAWPIVLLASLAWYVPKEVREREASSGRHAGRAIAGLLPEGCELWADGLVEARPEILRAAAETCARQGRRVRVRWIGIDDWKNTRPAAGSRVFLAVRDDALGDESAQLAFALPGAALVERGRGSVHKYSFRVLEMAGFGATP